MSEPTETGVQNELDIEYQDPYMSAYIELLYSEHGTEIFLYETYNERIPQPAPAAENIRADDNFRRAFAFTTRDFFLSIMVSLMLLQKTAPTTLDTILTFHLRSMKLDGLELLKIFLACAILVSCCLFVFMEYVLILGLENRLIGWLEMLEEGMEA